MWRPQELIRFKQSCLCSFNVLHKPEPLFCAWYLDLCVLLEKLDKLKSFWFLHVMLLLEKLDKLNSFWFLHVMLVHILDDSVPLADRSTEAGIQMVNGCEVSFHLYSILTYCLERGFLLSSERTEACVRILSPTEKEPILVQLIIWCPYCINYDKQKHSFFRILLSACQVQAGQGQCS